MDKIDQFIDSGDFELAYQLLIGSGFKKRSAFQYIKAKRKIEYPFRSSDFYHYWPGRIICLWERGIF